MGFRYCFARGSHTYLGLNSGPDFGQRIIVKTNIVEVLDRELTRKRAWKHELFALGTNTDPYQRAEGRYRLMPSVIDVLASHATPFSILTKGTLIRRDIPALVAAHQRVSVEIGMSIAILDDSLRLLLEPGAPNAAARLETVRQLTESGFDVAAFLMPVVPFLTDSAEQIVHALQRIKAAGATTVRHGVLHLRPGALESMQAWVRWHRPDLGPRFSDLYGKGAYKPVGYRQQISEKVHALAADLGLRSLDDEDQPLAQFAR